ncbi:ATP-dependent DNA helicase [Trichonephila clavipes]|nr:ATP-dependent DNA helicase [Trichonephila clavipes]
MHEKFHAIIRLQVHLPNMQPVYFFDDEEHQAFERAAQRNSMLTAWFDLNGTDNDANRYLYAYNPKHFVWKNNKWEIHARLGDRFLSRLYSISPKNIYRFHLWILLFHVPGAKSFEKLKTYEGVMMTSFKEACRARNLLEDDGEWRNCLREACSFKMSLKLRQLFTFICVFCNPSSPLELWAEFKSYLCEDFEFHTSVHQSVDLALHIIVDQLHTYNMTLMSIGLPEPDISHAYVETNSYNLEAERQEGERLMSMLNLEQRTIFDAVIRAIQDVDEGSPKAFCVNDFAWSGKSFLFNSIIYSVRGLGESVVPVAWTGISAVVLEGGRTALSRFKLPVPFLDNTSCAVRHNTLKRDNFLRR